MDLCGKVEYLGLRVVFVLCYLGIYFGRPRGFGTNENGEETGFNTEIYAAHEVSY